MPYIPQNVINGVFYLYKDRADAEAGQNPGGTGFIVEHQTWAENISISHYYGVTNWHVACDGGFSVIRLNTKAGGTDILEFGPEDWHFVPSGPDVAAVALSLDHETHDVSSVSTRLFCLNPREHQYGHGGVGVGDDVFMIGLFIDHDGVAVNVPSARFGNVSMMPNPRALIEQPTRYKGECFVIDMHSRSGFSGSPVYVYRTFGSDLTNNFFGQEVEISGVRVGIHNDRFSGRVHLKNTLFRLLGIHWGQFPERWELRDKKKLTESRRDVIVDGAYVEGMSGMTCVTPAWEIEKALDQPMFQNLRSQRIADAMKRKTSKPIPERASSSAKTEVSAEPESGNPSHKEDFMRLLNAAVKGQSPKDRT